MKNYIFSLKSANLQYSRERTAHLQLAPCGACGRPSLPLPGTPSVKVLTFLFL